jgi:hypothetical protein
MRLDRHHPKEFLEWAKKEKCLLAYYDKVSMRPQMLNMSEIFDQMNSSQKINALQSMVKRLLSEDERSFFITELTNPETVQPAVEEKEGGAYGGEEEEPESWT